MSTTKKETKTLLKELKIYPKKVWGQNFLIDITAIKKIIKAAQIDKNDHVVEIGPGLGALTKEIVDLAKKVIAIEIDKKLATQLKNMFSKKQNLEILNKDVLALNLEKLNLKNYKVIGSLPYSTALPIIRKFLEVKNPPKLIVVVIQKEVAQKICSKKMSLVRAAIKFYGEPKIVGYISKKSFFPQPKVDGAILKITNIQQNTPQVDPKTFFKFLKAGFASPRKTILNNLSNKLKLKKEFVKEFLKKLGVGPLIRAEYMDFETWIKISCELKTFCDKIKINGEDFKKKS